MTQIFLECGSSTLNSENDSSTIAKDLQAATKYFVTSLHFCSLSSSQVTQTYIIMAGRGYAVPTKDSSTPPSPSLT